jgi:hypothetical protein
MADLPLPQEMIDWMTARNWGQHHVEWHFVRRWDYWHAFAPSNPSIQAMVDAAVAAGWTRASLQEGELGSGVDFLSMHRAMFHILLKEFPQHSHYLRGWSSPPTDPADPEDPVSSGATFQAEKVSAIAELESPSTSLFPDEDGWGLFLETSIRPVPGNPTNLSTDLRTGIHNYMHNRWSDNSSPINLGDPSVNIFNQRFWKLHGWIDYQWWRFRAARGLSDEAPAYQAALQSYVTMMDMTHPHPHFAPGSQPGAPSPFGKFFANP